MTTNLFNFNLGMIRSAHLSVCGRYRYSLSRVWDQSLPTVCFVMLNPSTADASKDDPTIRKCIGFAKLWSHGGVSVVNLFAWRATNPRELLKAPDPVGPLNDHSIAGTCTGRDVIAAWGRNMAQSKRGEFVTALLTQCARNVECLAFTKDGFPSHPLYLPYSSPRMAYPEAIGRQP